MLNTSKVPSTRRAGRWRTTLAFYKQRAREAFYETILPHLLLVVISILRIVRYLDKPYAVDQSEKAILISYPNGAMGDATLLLPVLDEVAACWPGHAIDAVIHRGVADLFHGHPLLRNLYVYQPRKVASALLQDLADIWDLLALAKTVLQKNHYRIGISTRWDSDIYGLLRGYLSYLSNAPIRCAYSASVDGGGLAADLLQTHLATGGAFEHELLRQTRVLRRSGAVPAGTSEVPAALIAKPIHWLREIARRQDGAAIKRQYPFLSDGYIVVSPSAANPRRIWPAENVAQIMRRVKETYGLNSVVIGGPGDAALCEEIVHLSGDCAHSIAGKTTIPALINIISGAVLFLGNDSGPAHLAGGLAIATVVVSPFPLSCTLDHPNAPMRFHPCGPQVAVIQPALPLAPCKSYCERDEPHCITQITPDEVFAVVADMLKAQFVTIV